jgi:tetratricopeptide (TPR) repeat protein
MAKVLGNLGMIADQEGNYVVASALYQESLASHRQLNNDAGIASLLGNLGIIAAKCCNYDQASVHFEDALAIFRKLDMRRSVATLTGNLGSLETLRGHNEAARSLHEESLALHRALRNRAGILHALCNLGNAYVALGDFSHGRSCLSECLREYHEQGQLLGIAAAIDGFAALADAENRAEKSASAFGAAEALRESMGTPLAPAERQVRDSTYRRLRSSLGEAAFSAAFFAGGAGPLEKTVEVILAD